MTTTYQTTCAACGVTFDQPDDPGRRREYCSGACRQRAYRARGGRASGTRRESASARQRREEQEAWAREEARREQERQRSRRRRGQGASEQQAGSADDRWTWARADDDAATAKRRRTCRLLVDRANHRSTPPAEAAACREKAQTMRARYGL